MVENNIMNYFQELYTVSLFFTALHLFKKKKS